jgi:hypothetical protein
MCRIATIANASVLAFGGTVGDGASTGHWDTPAVP